MLFELNREVLAITSLIENCFLTLKQKRFCDLFWVAVTLINIGLVILVFFASKKKKSVTSLKFEFCS